MEAVEQFIDRWEFVRGDLGGPWEAWRSDAMSNGLPGWTPVTIPHCYNDRDAVDPDGPYYQGPAWYRTSIPVANPFPAGRTALAFEGAGQAVTIYVDSQKVAHQVGGYTPFEVDITEAVAQWRQRKPPAQAIPRAPLPGGDVPVAVRCDNRRQLDGIPSDLSDFHRYGGLYRPVRLQWRPPIALQEVTIRTQRRRSDWQVRISAVLTNPSRQEEAVSARVDVRDPAGEVVFADEVTVTRHRGRVRLAQFAVRSPALWSPDTPRLYTCEVVLTTPSGVTRRCESFGFRWFTFETNGPFYLNGERLLLRGTHRHEDHAGLGAAMPDDLVEREMQLMKAMGVNFIRLGHYPQSPLVLRLCDALGFLVWEEIPWCRGGLGSGAYRKQATACLRAMVRRDRNRPSVILWGLGNENDWPGDFEVFDKDAIRAFMQELHTLAHRLDPDRLTAIRRCAFCRDVVDVYSPSIWAGWYRGMYQEYKEISRKEIAQCRHFLHVEWGGDSHAGRHAEDPYTPLGMVRPAGSGEERGQDFRRQHGPPRVSKDGDWSETYICDLMDWHLKEQETMPELTGTACWLFKDFATPLRPDNPVPYVNQKGVVERDLTPKESYYVFQSYWSSMPMVHIYGHDWPVRWGAPDERRWVKVYSNCPEVELFVNGQTQGVCRRDPADFPAAGLRWEVLFAAGTNRVKACGRTAAGRVIEDDIHLRYETRSWGPPAKLKLDSVATDGDTAWVEATLLDEAEVICLDAAAFVQFSLAGPGTLLDNGGTVRTSRRVQLANGRAMIGIRMNGATSVVAVVTDGVAPAFAEVGPAMS